MPIDDKEFAQATQSVESVAVEAHDLARDCTIPESATNVDALESTAQKNQARRFSGDKKGSGGLDSLGGGNIL